jgi:hypothetical protein
MKTVLTTLLWFGLLAAALAQTPNPNTPPVDTVRNRNYSLYLNDGTALFGRIIRKDSSNYTVRLKTGLITYVPLDLLKSLGAGRPKQQQMVVLATSPKSVVADTNTTPKNGYVNRFGPYLLLNQTAYNPEAGRMYFRNQYGIVNQLDYGITKFWSAGATVAPFKWFLKDEGVLQNIVLNTKLTFPINAWLQLGANTAYRPAYTNKVLSFDYRVAAQWQLEALASFGNSQQNITVAYGWKLSKANNGNQAPTYLRIGAVVKLTPKLSFVSDNVLGGRKQFNVSGDSQFSGAFRFDRQRHSFDVGVLGVITSQYSGYYCPYCSYFPNNYFYNQRKIIPIPYVGYNLLINSYRGRP